MHMMIPVLYCPVLSSSGLSTHNIIILHPVRLAPCVHDPGIVESEDGDEIDALGLDLVEVLDVAGEMLRRATGSESACTIRG